MRSYLCCILASRFEMMLVKLRVHVRIGCLAFLARIRLLQWPGSALVDGGRRESFRMVSRCDRSCWDRGWRRVFGSGSRAVRDLEATSMSAADDNRSSNEIRNRSPVEVTGQCVSQVAPNGDGYLLPFSDREGK